MSRHSRDKLLFAVFAIGSLLALMVAVAELGHRQRVAGAVTVEEVTPTRTPQLSATVIEPSPTPTASPAPRVQLAEPLMFECPEGGLIIPWNTNWDAEPHECLRKLWALRSREGALHPLYSRYRRDRCGAAWAACPVWFRR